jgi:hypothetical protein
MVSRCPFYRVVIRFLIREGSDEVSAVTNITVVRIDGPLAH